VWKEEGAGAWSSAAGRQLAEGIGDRTDTCGSMRKCAAVQEMDGAILARLHHIQWCWQLAAPNGSAARGDWRTMVAGMAVLGARGPGAGPLPLSNSH
jgi:hypothetical protein